MESFWIFRGQSRTGIGLSPGVPPVPGEQYIASHRSLWNNDVADFARQASLWLTFDALGSASGAGERAEAWSYFSYDGGKDDRQFCFVARLFPNGRYSDNRSAYLTHARGWRRSDCIGRFDPGKLIGTGVPAFAGPTNGDLKQELEGFKPRDDGPPPEDAWLEVLRAGASAVSADKSVPEKVVATRLMACLYQACVDLDNSGRPKKPVVMKVRPDEFYQGSPLHKLVAFARAGLPARVKVDARIRIYTQFPDAFLAPGMDAHLVVIPEELDGVALRARPDAVLIDRLGRIRGGADIAGSVYHQFAEAVVEQFTGRYEHRFVPALFDFAARVEDVAGLGPGVAPTSRAIAIVPSLYELLAVSAIPEAGLETDKKLLRTALLYSLSHPAPEVQPWEKLLPGDIDRETLQEAGRCTKRASDTMALLRAIWSRLREQGLRIDPPEECDAEWILEYFAAGFVDSVQASERLRPLSIEQVWEVMQPGRAIRLTGDGVSMSQCLAKVAFGSVLPKDWAARLPEMGTPREAAERLSHVAAAAQKDESGSAWETALYPALRRLLKAEEAFPVQVAGRVKELREPAVAEHWLLMAETLCRCEACTPDAVHDLLGKKTDREFRRWIFLNRHEKLWTSLKSFDEPLDWDADVRDLVVMAPKRLERMTGPRLVSLVAHSAGTSMPEPVLRKLDEILSRELSELDEVLRSDKRQDRTRLDGAMRTTYALTWQQYDGVRSSHWMRWRMASLLGPEQLRLAAKAWLMDARAGRPTTLDEWEQCLQDLWKGPYQGLKGLEISQMRLQSANFTWPFIPMLRTRQITDLVRLARDYGAVVEIAEIAGETCSDISQKIDPPEHQMPINFLEYLTPSVSRLQSLSVDQARRMYNYAGHRRAYATKALVSAVLDLTLIKSEPERSIQEMSRGPDLWHEPEFQRRLIEIVLLPLPEPFLRGINARMSAFPSLWIGYSEVTLKEAVQRLRDSGHNNIADVLSRGIPRGLVYEQVVNAMRNGDEKAECWMKLIGKVRRNELSPDPWGEVLAVLRSLDPVGRAELDQAGTGWRVFKNACSREKSELLYDNKGRIPAFDVAMFLRPQPHNPGQSLGCVAADLLAVSGLLHPFGWYDALFSTMRTARRRREWPEIEDNFNQALLTLPRGDHRLESAVNRYVSGGANARPGQG